MALAPGTRLGPYEVTGPIGAGGMGEVYRATDTSLKRQVAIKVLPAAVAGDAERLARFQREAEVLAALNHPHIAQIHGLERSNGAMAIVMEFVEGPTLADRIAHGPIPVDEALPMARQIAEALEAAHEQGIVHRDLKPANIKVRPDGTVKVLDFGLAKAMEPARVLSPDASRSSTITSPAMTEPGIILGTAAYMSPEQARGRPVDKRADIWAFGCVAYEMLTGRRAFEAEDVPLTLSSVLQREPDWHGLPNEVPALVTTLLRRCLVKDPRQRVRDMGDVRLMLDGAFDVAGTPARDGGEPALALWQRPVAAAAIVAGAVAAAALTTWSVTRPATAPPSPVTRTAIVLPPAHVRTSFGRRGIAISPAGTHLVYVANGRLYLRALGELEARAIPGCEGKGPTEPFFSPDGQWIGFYSAQDGALEKVGLGGGSAVRVVAASGPLGASWGADDTIVFGQEGQGIVRVSASGGTAEVLVEAEAPTLLHQPQVLPGGRALLYTRCPSGCFGPDDWDAAQVVVEDLTTGERTVLVEGGTDGRYLQTGQVLYALGDTLLAVPFDVSRRTVTGSPSPLVQGVSRAGVNGAVNADVSQTGTLVYIGGGVEGRRRLVWVDLEGREEVISAPLRPYYTPRLSPDGGRLVMFANDAQRDLWVWDFARAALTRLTDRPETELFGVWMPDSQRVVFNLDRRQLYRRAADGAGVYELLLESEAGLPTSVSPDGMHLVHNLGRGSQSDLHLLTLGVEPGSQPLIATQFSEIDAEISPDGRWVAYVSNASAEYEVYVRPFPGVDRQWRVSTTGGMEPLWAPDGRALFYRTPAGVMKVAVEAKGDEFVAGAPALILSGAYFGGPGRGRSYDISQDGQRFLMLKEAAGSDPDDPIAGLTHVVVVQHWFEEVKARVAAP